MSRQPNDEIQRAFMRGWQRGGFWAIGFVALTWIASKVGDVISNLGLSLAVGGSIILGGGFVLWKVFGLPKRPQG